MRYNVLGKTDIKVSAICLGTMTFGEQNTQAEGHEQLDYAFDQGINFIDTAELYAIPPKAETQGRTEEIIGTWLTKRGNRDEIFLASKIAGPDDWVARLRGEGWVTHIREGNTRFNDDHIAQALDASLARLQTDYIDLYQLHWPERSTNYFGKLNYEVDDNEPELTSIHHTLQALQRQIKAGKIRYIGLSNETPWGMMQFLTVAKQYDLPIIQSVQNPYNLLCRTFEIGCAEISHREQVGLLAYSPLGFGALTGKYLHGAQPAGARMTLWPNYGRYGNQQAVAATLAYVKLAQDNDLDPAQMALAFVNDRFFVTSTIIGATNMAQLKTDIASIDITLSEAVLADIERIHNKQPNPAP